MIYFPWCISLCIVDLSLAYYATYIYQNYRLQQAAHRWFSSLYFNYLSSVLKLDFVL